MEGERDTTFPDGQHENKARNTGSVVNPATPPTPANWSAQGEGLAKTARGMGWGEEEG